MPDIYTIPQVADMLGRSVRTIQNWIRTGRLEVTEVTSKSRYVTAAQLDRFLNGGGS